MIESDDASRDEAWNMSLPKSQQPVQAEVADKGWNMDKPKSQQPAKLPTPDEGMQPFAREVSKERAESKAYKNTHTPVGSRKVESHTTAAPMAAKAAQPQHRAFEPNLPEIVRHKPFPFALEHDSTGAMCYFGSLITGFTYATTTVQLDYDGFAYVASTRTIQQEIAVPLYHPAINLNTVTDWSFRPTKLNFFGDVYLKWECTELGVVDDSTVEVVGPDAPALVQIPAFDSTTPTSPTTCRYFVKIGRVDEDGTITQLISSDFHWYFHLQRGAGTV